MFNRRRRSYRKGPPANQIYVPHDQRNINQDPIPITTEKQAQYYYKQLYSMGYIPNVTPPTPVFTMPDIITITTHDNYRCLFSIDYQTLQMTNQNMDEDPPIYNITDVHGNDLDIDSDTKRRILEQDGYILFPFLIRGNLGFRNEYAVSDFVYYYDSENNQRGNSAVSSGDIFNFPSLTQAFCTANVSSLQLLAHEENRSANANDLYWVNSSYFRISCTAVTCFISKTQ